MKIYKEFQKEAGRVWNPKDSIFYPLINFNNFPLLFKVKKKFPKILDFDCICYKEHGNYLILYRHQQLESVCRFPPLEATMGTGVFRVADAL